MAGTVSANAQSSAVALCSPVLRLQAAAAKLRSQIDATVEVLPSLEACPSSLTEAKKRFELQAEKKLAVASRSFKEACHLHRVASAEHGLCQVPLIPLHVQTDDKDVSIQ